MSGALLDKLADLESRHAWSTLATGGHEWRWLDTGGEGPPVVLLPGSVGDAAMFVLTLLSLGERLRLVAVTYPAESDPAALADGLAEVMDHIGLPAATVAGSSFAAYWAQYFALRHPQKVLSLVIGNGFTDGSDLADNPLFDRGYVEGIEPDALHAEWLGRIRSAPASELSQLQETMLAQRQSPRNLHARFLGVVRSTPCPALPIPASRITVLDCEDDPLIPPAARARLRARYPDALHVSLKRGGHYPHLLNPQDYEAALLRCAS
ncbi:alpha/beta fold hydrolase [Pusillimonas noertemannii]|uniref:Maspardin n=1 Tax=Pusillimonas noertemannii TaxID=305977 RepID=A0A2U1CH29_9BURK|nr:alpha/beta hydrolase [Pusillimonas noertemannii]NYT68235.1 alpha/beta hydrolase [Pusillimonas noertemannii]PVY60205.1 pimeloyl-ACP methyl ester carboxylesterase [Pusillimonas noertemannii]TFL10315.1 alpha/beta hydrolase [Pusillimonas noertemannii]